ncbi:hypothetical protein PDIDSM_1385 [Penicillium digitatum]|nr:hypothetical protein PDIDSM_1385 [Penicillium digitatum]
MSIPTPNDEQLEQLLQLRVRADQREYACQSILQETKMIMGISAGLTNLYAGDVPRWSHSIPAMLLTLEQRMLGLLDGLFGLWIQGKIDKWVESSIWETIG